MSTTPPSALGATTPADTSRRVTINALPPPPPVPATSGTGNQPAATMALEDARPKYAAASTAPLGQDLGGCKFSGTFNYASLVGMMSHLCNHTWCDIAFELQAKYLLHIGKYLKATRNMGLILKPIDISSLKIDCYINADFQFISRIKNSQKSRNNHRR